MEMWKNFPLPPWGIALVKKNLWPSWAKSGASFCSEGRRTHREVNVGLKPPCRDFWISADSRVEAQIQCVYSNLSVQPTLTLILLFLKNKRKQHLTQTRVWKAGQRAFPLLHCKQADVRSARLTLMQTPVVASHRVRIELFWARFSQLTASLVLVAHFTMVM